MSKIALFSSIMEENNHLSSIQSKIHQLSSELHRTKIGSKKLSRCKQDLLLLQAFASDFMEDTVSSSIYRQKWRHLQDEINTLLHTCEDRMLDRKIDELTEKAQIISLQLAKDLHGLSSKVKKFKKEVRKISKTHALSLENKKMLQAAGLYMKGLNLLKNGSEALKKADVIRLEVQKELEEHPLQDESEIGITLYELAGDLYHHRLDLAKLHYFELPQYDQSKLDEYLDQKGLKLEQLQSCDNLGTWEQKLYPLIDGILGYVHTKMFGEESHLDPRDIDDIFMDSSVTSHYRGTAVNL